MRIWTLHPKYLDPQGLVALWREGLLAKAVLEGKTQGYTSHPQIDRFRQHHSPLVVLCSYLQQVLTESDTRGYSFDHSKLPPATKTRFKITTTLGQLRYEWRHLSLKLKQRSPGTYNSIRHIRTPDHNHVFRIVDGPIAPWERTTAN